MLDPFLRFMHQSFVSQAPLGSGNSGAFNFSIFKAPLKARLCEARVVVKSLLKALAPNVKQQLGAVQMKLKYDRGAWIYACKSKRTFAN